MQLELIVTFTMELCVTGKNESLNISVKVRRIKMKVD